MRVKINFRFHSVINNEKCVLIKSPSQNMRRLIAYNVAHIIFDPISPLRNDTQVR